MTSEKQIEEMVIALIESQHEFDKAWHECLHNNGKQPEKENVFYAKYLIENKGYRKASEIAEEFVEVIEAIIEDYPPSEWHEGYNAALRDLATVFKKKYTEEEE